MLFPVIALTPAMLGLYLLVLAAVVMAVMAVSGWLTTYAESRAQRLNEDESKDTTQKNALAAYISTGQLYQLQVGAGAFAAAVAIAVILFCGSTAFWQLGVGAAVAAFLVAHEIRQHYVRKVKKRVTAFRSQMLDFSMGLANGLKAGQALPQSLEVYARNAPEPLFTELRTVLREYRLGVELTEALTRMYRRNPCEDLQLMIVSIKLTMTSGGSLSEVLDKMTDTIRSRDDFHRKLSALTAQGRFEALAMSLAPVAAFVILTCVDSTLTTPLLTTLTGWIAIGVDVALITVGYTVIRMITNVEV